MKIAIDARGINWYKGTGIGTYTENLIRGLQKIDEHNFYNIYWSGDSYDEFKKNNTKVIMASRKHHRFFEQYYFPANLAAEKTNIFHIPQNGIGLSEEINCRKIVTIHDLIPYVMPETVGKGYVLKFLKEVPNIVEFSDAILTVSEWSKKDILRFFPIDENKIFVTPLAADQKYKPLDKAVCKNFLNDNYHIDAPFVLYLGGFSSRKNVRSLIIAFSKVYKNLDEKYKLVIIGANKDDSGKLYELCTSLNLNSSVIFTGFVPEEHLPAFYNGCDVFAYPSFYEGFGLPPLEAMSCGAPVITSNITSIPEVVGNAGVLIDPYDTNRLVDELGKLLCNEGLRQELSLKGLDRAKDFNWINTAKKTLDAYEQVNLLTEL